MDKRRTSYQEECEVKSDCGCGFVIYLFLYKMRENGEKMAGTCSDFCESFFQKCIGKGGTEAIERFLLPATSKVILKVVQEENLDHIDFKTLS